MYGSNFHGSDVATQRILLAKVKESFECLKCTWDINTTFSYVIWFMLAKSASSYSFYSVLYPHYSYPLSFSLFLANSSDFYSSHSVQYIYAHS